MNTLFNLTRILYLHSLSNRGRHIFSKASFSQEETEVEKDKVTSDEVTLWKTVDSSLRL